MIDEYRAQFAETARVSPIARPSRAVTRDLSPNRNRELGRGLITPPSTAINYNYGQARNRRRKSIPAKQ